MVLTNIRSLSIALSNINGQTSRFKIDFGTEGDAYWIFPETGHKVSFHKSGEIHIKNNYNRDYYKEIDLSQDSLSNIELTKYEQFQQFLEGKYQEPEGRTVYAWKVPHFKEGESQIFEKFYQISGRHAVVSINSQELMQTMLEASPILYETTDTKLQETTLDAESSIAIDPEGSIFIIGKNRIFDMTDLANISFNTMTEVLGPFGRILDILGENMFYDYDTESEQVDTSESSLFDNLKLEKLN